MTTFLLVLMLACAAWPLGRWVTSTLPPRATWLTRVGLETLAGLAGFAAGSHALLALGIPARFGIPIVASLGALGWLQSRPRGVERPSAPISTGLQVGAMLLIATLSASPLALAARHAPVRHDTTFIWMPKAVRATDEAPPSPMSSPENAHAEYPRGWACLIAAAGGFSHRLDQRSACLLGVLIFVLLLLAILEAAALQGSFVAGLLAVAATGACPEVVNTAPSGLADLPLAACVLLATVALRKDSGSPWLLAVAAAGAGAIKDEGLVVAAIATMTLLVRAAKGRDFRLAVIGLVPWGFLVPWLVLRDVAGSRSTLLLPGIIDNVGLILRRVPELVHHIATMAFGPSTPELQSAYPGLIAGSVWVLPMTFVAFLIAALGRSPFSLRIVLWILASSAIAYLVTPEPLSWHVWTSAERLAVQSLPSLALIATTALLVRRAPHGPDRATPAM